VMPAFPWLFDGAPEKPKQAARDLVGYLETLGRDRELAGPEGEAHARAACQCSDEERRLAFDSGTLNGNPAMARRRGDYPQLAAAQDPKRGLELYARNCASCHGAHGEGDGPGAKGLHPHPGNLTEHEYTLDAVSAALWNGVDGTSMPAWRDLPPQDLAEIAAVVVGFHRAGAAPAGARSELGAQVYADHCAQCHGDLGDGTGPASDRFPIAASNFRTARPSLDVALQALRNGVDGTPMAPWSSQLSEAEITAVAEHVRGLFEPGGSRP
jgi:cytochrome c oxidase cbb3-type subunit 2